MIKLDFSDWVIWAKVKCQNLNLAYVNFTYDGIKISVGKSAKLDNLSEVLQEAHSKGFSHIVIGVTDE